MTPHVGRTVMTAIHETAYPRIRSNLSDKELEEVYTPTPDDLAFIHRSTKSTVAAFGGVVLLKTFQRLGYFPLFDALPPRLIHHLATAMGVLTPRFLLRHYDQRRLREWHVPQIRDYLGIAAFSEGGRRVLVGALLDAARSKDMLADLINVGLEALVEARYELPAFSTLQRAAQKARAQVNHGYYRQVYAALDDSQRAAITRVLSRDDSETTSPWQRLKREPKQPTIKRLREHIAHARWLHSLNTGRQALDGIPEAKLQRFADEARALNVSRMQAMHETKRVTLAVALIRVRTAQALDDVAEMFIRRMQKLHHQGQEALEDYHRQHQEQTDALISLLGQIVNDWQASETPDQRLEAIDTLIGEDADTIRAQCEAHLGYAGNNYVPFLPALFRSHRQTCLDVLEFLRPTSTSTDTALEQAMTFVLRQRHARAARLPVVGDGRDPERTLDLSWVPQRWWKAVTGRHRRDVPVVTVDRRYLELCVLSCVMMELKSGDLCIAGSEHFSDYRDQLVTWEEYAQQVETYCQRVGIAADPTPFAHDLQSRLAETICTTDAAFPTNTALTIQDGEPVLRRLQKQPDPEGLALIDRLLSERMPECNIVDVLTDTEHWLNWTAAFGPLSGFESRLASPCQRYVTTTFCYGCYLGPTQTARSLKDVDRFQVAYVNQYHITEQKLLEANVNVINRYNRFLLPKLWGSGQRASADGTKWDVYEQNLLSEYHLRYGGWGGIGYYHVSDTYIALFSSFIACGVWEAIYILDGLLQNRSEIRPDTLHADTQGQSEPVFGLAYLLAIQLMPRIRNWKDLALYVPSARFAQEHIAHLRELFTDTIDWTLITTHLPDMLRVALSISQGKVRSSTILRKLGTESRKNKLYVAFRELGRVVRTIFLLHFISDEELRRTINAATNISEAWNGFVQWVAFGGEGVIRQNNREEQRKIIRYNHLVANLVVFHNVVSMTRVLQELIDEGYPVTPEIIARLSPYKTEHINRFGHYELRFDQMPQPITEALRLSPTLAVG
jgi:TnpA family transposase